MRFLVAGCGSIGKRHLSNLRLLSAGEVTAYDTMQERQEEVRGKYGVKVHYIPLHLHPFYQREFGYRKGDYPRAERYYERAITLPIFPKMSDQDIEDVFKAVCKVIRYYRR